MKNARSLFALSAAAFVGIGLGFVAGSRTRPETTVSSASPAYSPDSQRTIPPALAPLPRVFQKSADAAATLRRLREMKNPRAQARELHALCAALDARGTAALLVALSPGGMSSPFERDLASQLLGRWAELDPRAAADFATGMDRQHETSSIYNVMEIWAESDLAAAKEWALKVRDRQAHLYGINAIVGFIAETNPQAAFAFIEELPPSENRAFYISSIFSRLGKKNPALAAKLAPQMATRALRETAVRDVATAWGEKEPDRALAWYLGNISSPESSWQGEQAVETLMKSWVRTTPDAAAAFAGGLPPGRARTMLIGKLGESWGAVDPEAAASWLQGLPKSSGSFLAFDSLVGTWTKNDPARAANFILSQPADRSRDWLLNTLGNNWAESDPAAALAWARQQNDPEIERRVATEAIGAMAAKDLANAVSYLSQLKSAEAKTRSVELVSYKIFRTEPERAVRWVMEMATAQQPIGSALEFPVDDWTQRDPEAVSAWLNQQADSALKDAAVGSYARTLARKDALTAAAWAVTIGDEATRQRRMKQVLTTWADQNRTAARTWVEQQPDLTVPERQALLQTVDLMGPP